MRAEDFAQEIELKEYEATQKRAIRSRQTSLSHCKDCGEAILAQRQAIGSITRCIECQEDFETMEKRGVNHG